MNAFGAINLEQPLRDICEKRSHPVSHGVMTRAMANEIAHEAGLSIPELALALVHWASSFAVIPISGFRVGAVAVGESGALYFGANMEFAGEALSFSLHGEQAAVNNAWINGETSISNLAVNAAPCGYCRQFLNELSAHDPLDILLPNTPKRCLTEYLPHAFGPADLGITNRLLNPQDNGLSCPSSDPVVSTALAAANASYAPYTQTYTGIALQSDDGTIISGRLAENAAYNPSLSPMVSALSHMTLYMEKKPTVARAVLVEAKGPASQVNACKAVLGTINPDIKLEIFRAS